ncbi:unnamed protein product [Ectocarpus sp. 6 AP-2014]
MRPHVKKVEAATAPWLQGPSDVIRDRAAAVLASLPLCGEAEAWTQAAGRVALEAHGLLHAAWPDNDVDMGTSDSMSASQLDAALGSGAGLLPPLGGGAGEGFSGPQQGLCHVLELMLTGDSNGRPVAVPVGLILALVERVQRMVSSVVKGQGPQVFIPVAQGALSHGALSVIRPSLGLAASRLLHALATTEASTVLRNARRFCRALVQGMAKPSDAGSLRTAGYRAVSRAVLQLGEGAAPYLATPALPAILAEVRSAVAASEPEAAGGGGGAGGESSFEVVAATGAPGVAAVGGGSKKGMGIEPAMSARKSSQKKQRRSREKEVGRALAAADAAAAAATATAASSSSGGGGGGGGAGQTGAAALAEEQAVCAGLSCLSRVVVCCKGHLPLGGRLAVEEVLHRGLELLSYAGEAAKGSRGDGGRGGGGGGGASGGGRRCARLEDPRVAREFLGLAHACLMTPLADGTRSGSLSVAIAAFRSFASHPDQRLAAASQQALAGCGAVLYPRAAPLHLPHAVTSQARAWGGSSASSTGRGLPMGWGDTLMVAEGESAQEESQEDLEDYQHPGRGGEAAGGGGMALTVRAAELAAEGLTAAAVAGPVVTPPPPPPPAAAQTAALEEGGRFPQTVPRHASSTTAAAAAAAAASAGAENGDAATTSKSGSGKGKGKGKGRVGGGAAGGEGSGDGGSSAGAGVVGTVEEDRHNDNEAEAAEAAATAGARKRPRNDGDGDDARNAMDDEEEEEEKVAVVAPRGAAASEGGGVPAVVKQTQQPVSAILGGGDEDDDDDDFEFPAIVDADPDVE